MKSYCGLFILISFFFLETSYDQISTRQMSREQLPKDTYSQLTWLVTREGFCMNAAFSSFEGIEESKITLHCYQFTPSNK